VTHRELKTDQSVQAGPDERRELSNGLLTGVNEKAPDTGVNGVQDDGDDQKTAPIQAQEA
jgi:hypothetical protein